MSVLIERLEDVRDRGNGQYMAKCPAHEDKRPSLSVRECSDGTVLIKCFAGCSPIDIVSAVGLELHDLFPQQFEARPHQHKQRFNPRDLLALLRREAVVVVIAAEQVAKGKPLSDHDQRRLMAAAGRIRYVAAHCQ